MPGDGNRNYEFPESPGPKGPSGWFGSRKIALILAGLLILALAVVLLWPPAPPGYRYLEPGKVTVALVEGGAMVRFTGTFTVRRDDAMVGPLSHGSGGACIVRINRPEACPNSDEKCGPYCKIGLCLKKPSNLPPPNDVCARAAWPDYWGLGEHEFSKDVAIADLAAPGNQKSFSWKVLTCANKAVGNDDALPGTPGNCSITDGIFKLGD